MAPTEVSKKLECYDKVLEVMNAPNRAVDEAIEERVRYGEEWTVLMRGLALEYARLYALRDVMTLMVEGYEVSDALEAWKADNGPIGMLGEVENAVSEAWEDLGDCEDEEED